MGARTAISCIRIASLLKWMYISRTALAQLHQQVRQSAVGTSCTTRECALILHEEPLVEEALHLRHVHHHLDLFLRGQGHLNLSLEPPERHGGRWKRPHG